MMKTALTLSLTAIALLTSCGQQGVQGTSLYSSFAGINAAEPQSPTSIKVSWNLDSRYSEYRIYQNNSLNPVQKETFSNTTVTGLNPGSDYTFMVSSYSDTAGEQILDNKITTRTWSRFEGLKEGGVTLSSSTEVKLTWSMNADKATYKVFQKRKNSSGVWDFEHPIGTVVGQNQYNIASLTPGATYCFYVVAYYLDGSSEPSASATAADVAAPCQQLTSPMEGLPSVSISSVVPGEFPWFWTSNGNSAYRTEIYELSTNTRVASRLGNGQFRAFQPTTQGSKNYYALVSSNTNVSRVPVSISGGSSPSSVKIRTTNPTGSQGPIYPPVLSDGRGQQNLGNQIVAGDFNCDGYPDIAVAAYTSTPFSTDRHYKSIGSVVVYYSWFPPPYLDSNNETVTPDMELKTDVAPSANAVFPNPLLITYPVTTDQAQIGRNIAVGNFNGDCYFNGSPASRDSCNSLFASKSSVSDIQKIKSCDDLVITTNAGYFYTVFGDPIYGIVAGSMSNSTGIDETTCDSASNTCRTARYNAPSGYVAASFGSAVTTGDYNNDGYDDIALAASQSTGPKHVLIYRGNGQGVIPFGHSRAHANVLPLNISTTGTYGSAIAASDDFAASLGTAYNSRVCMNGSPSGYTFRSPEPTRKKGYDLTKCDDLVIGMPSRASGRGSIVSCKATISPGTSDIPKIASWSCAEHHPDTASLLTQSPPITVTGYGSTLLGVPNQNGYPLASNVGASSPSQAIPDVGGALFVGAPNSTIDGRANAGAVFGYYVTPNSTNYSVGGIQGILGNSSSGHNVAAVNAVACDQLNTNATSGSLRHCDHQVFYPSPTSGGARFGYAMSSVPDRVSGTDPWMPLLAVSAPYRNTTDLTGNTIAETGTIYLFRGDISTFGKEGTSPITVPKYYVDNALNPNCTSNCTWYSGGISPFGPTVVYPNGLTANAHFGIGGAAGGSFNQDDFADIISTAPGHNSPSYSNGAIFAFFSSQGSFSPAVNTPNITITENKSLEGNYRFEEAKVIGDINGDGYQDVATHINNNGLWVMALYYGSASGLITSTVPSFDAAGNQPLLFNWSQDSGLGKAFFPAGDVNGDGFDDIFVLGNNGSYLYYGSSSGLITNVDPDISPIGKNPMRFAITGVNALTFHNAGTHDYAAPLATSSEYNTLTQSVSHGYFNDDDYADIAIRVYSSSFNTPSAVPSAGLTLSGNVGRVFVLYGGANGPETNRITGQIKLKNVVSGVDQAGDVVVENPCNPGSSPVCQVQLLASPDVGVGYGFSVATRKGLNSSTSDEFDGLLVSDPRFNTNDGIVYVYQGSIRGLTPQPIQKLVPRDADGLFGYNIVEVGDINKDLYQDVVISSGAVNSSLLTVFYGAKIGGQNAYFGAGSLASTNYWAAPAIVDNEQHPPATSPRPQVLVPNIYTTDDYLGRGLTALGDFNQDGYMDFAVNVPNGDFTVSGTIYQTGYVLVYFGSETGVQSQNKLASPYPTCYGGVTPICEPFQIFLPEAKAYEFTSLSPNSAGDLNGDGLKDLMIGGFGRNHPSGKAISSGVIYVVY